MKETPLTREIAAILVGDRNFPTSKTGSRLFFNENYVSSLYAEKFDIPQCERERFEKAFLIVTNGVGNEAAKVNSVISSSLLSLLAFYRLFGDNHEDVSLDICLNGITYTFKKAFFEVRNKVIGYPSCMDVVLQADDGTLLFLESKFTEYIDGQSNENIYGASYIDLYKKRLDVLLKGNINVTQRNDFLVLSSDKKQYIEGIKQSISHLIGLVKGPQEHIDQYYNSEYLDSYKSAFEAAPKMFYATILFNPVKLFSKEKENNVFNDYVELFSKTIGENGAKILNEIKTWCENTEHRNYDVSKIEIISEPITYQDLFTKNPWFLPLKVAKFYHL